MNKSDLVTLVNFNFWANERILAACERISADEFTRPHNPHPGWGSLRGILVHALDAEYGWRCVLQALNADDILEADDFNDVAALKSRWDMEHTAWLDYLATLSDTNIHLGYGDNPSNGLKVWQTILHVVTHGIQHRSEAAAILTGYNQSPGELDFDLFLKEKPEFR